MAGSVADLPLFSPPPMARAEDAPTSQRAAARVLPKVNAIHSQVLAAIRAEGDAGLTDRELETLPQFAHYAPSTVRKRRSELYQAQQLTHRGTRAGLMVWVLTEEAR